MKQNTCSRSRQRRVGVREEGIREDENETVDIGGRKITLVKVVIYCVTVTYS